MPRVANSGKQETHEKISKNSAKLVKHKIRLTKLGKTQKTHKKSEGFASLLRQKIVTS